MSGLDQRKAEVVESGADRLERVFAAETRRRLRGSVGARSLALLVVGALLLLIVPWPEVLFYHALILGFIAIGLAQYALARSAHDRDWHAYAFVALYFVLIGLTLMYPNPFAANPLPAQFQFRFGNFAFFYLILVSTAFFFDPRLVLWAGASGAAVWVIGTVIIVAQPETISILDDQRDMTAPGSFFEVFGNPYFVDLGVRVQEVVVFLLIAGLLALVVQGSRNLVLRQAVLERRMGNLSRYFPPALASRLAGQDRP